MERMTVRFWGGRLVVAAIAVLLVVLAGATSALAQVDTGSILGTVTDSSGAAVSGASVTLINEGTGAELTTTAGSDGNYRFTPVRIGSYKLKVTVQGFQTSEQHGVTVDVGQNVVADFALKPGSVDETVTVESTIPVLQSQDASVGQVIDAKSVNDLPLNGRNFTFLAQLSAGVNTPQADTRGNAASGAFAANGNRPAQNNYLLDGIDNNSDTVDFLNGTNFVVLPPVDAIQEFKVQTSDFSAEFGRSGAAVLNATIKSGTNQLHGAAWEFFRNDKLDAADFFENAGGVPKGALRQNQFGVTAGGPVIKNKIFFFADYEGLRRVQGTILTGTVPTAAERASGFTNFQDLITQTGLITDACGAQNSAARCDALGRIIPVGTVLDPATTRQVTAGSADPVTGLTATSSGFVRDPFQNGACGPTTMNFSGAAIGTCGLNLIPAGRLDPNAIKLLNLYPSPTSGSITSNFANSPKLFEHRNAFDARLDLNPNEKNQVFFRFSLADDPQFIPGIFGGVADGGGFQQGTQTANAQQSALNYTHTFSPTLINVVRAGLNYLHTTRASPSANDLSDIPSQFGIQDIPQLKENGGLPAFGIGGLQTLGSNAFLPSDEVTSTFQLTDDVTKIFGKHTFKMGFEWQHVKFSTLQPPWSRGEFDFNGDYTDVPNSNKGNTGRVQFLLTPTANSLGSGPDFVDFLGGATDIRASNIAQTDNGKNYWGGYVNDDWRVTNKLTLNLGLRYDFFGLVYEHHGAQANFVPAGTGPFTNPTYLLPESAAAGNLSPSFLSQLATDGIDLVVSNKYGKGLGNSQNHNFAPRIGFAYQTTKKLVVRGGWGMFYNGFENRGYSPNIGENYPFQFQFNFPEPNPNTPITFSGCTTAGPGNVGTFETGFSCTPLNPLLVNANGLGLLGIQFKYITPYTMSGNLTLQYQLTPSMSVQVGYVNSLARHLEVFPNTSNAVSQILPANANADNFVPFLGFGRNPSYAATEGNSNYHGLQTKVEKQFANGLNFLFAYTFSKTLSDADDLLNFGSADNRSSGNVNGYRAPGIPGMGIQADYGLANFDIRNVFHFSGGYQLPFGKGRKYMAGATGFMNQVVGGWSVNWSATFQGGQPIALTCPTQTAAGVACGALFTGQPLDLGLHTDSNGKLSWYGNPAAFTQPCALNSLGVPDPTISPAGCVSLTGIAALGGVTKVPGPGFKRVDLSFFKDFPITERFRLQFRTEIFNIANHPNFNAPNFGGNGVVAISNSGNFNSNTFGEIGSTRDAPYDPRQIQFALKFYY
jgi:Carboxypeptidase regulatory-like domain/TonB dependent receptor